MSAAGSARVGAPLSTLTPTMVKPPTRSAASRHPRKRPPARAAPRRPEIDVDDTALQLVRSIPHRPRRQRENSAASPTRRWPQRDGVKATAAVMNARGKHRCATVRAIIVASSICDPFRLASRAAVFPSKPAAESKFPRPPPIRNYASDVCAGDEARRAPLQQFQCDPDRRWHPPRTSAPRRRGGRHALLRRPGCRMHRRVGEAAGRRRTRFARHLAAPRWARWLVRRAIASDQRQHRRQGIVEMRHRVVPRRRQRVLDRWCRRRKSRRRERRIASAAGDFDHAARHARIERTPARAAFLTCAIIMS